MALPASGAITMAQVAAELGISAVGLNLNDARVRSLAGVPSGAISMQNLYGKQAFQLLNAPNVQAYNQGNTYFTVTYDGTNTNMTWNEGMTVKSLPLAKGQCNVRMRNGGVVYTNCVEAQWFLADGTARSVTNQTRGDSRDITVDVAPGGVTVPASTGTVNLYYQG